MPDPFPESEPERWELRIKLPAPLHALSAAMEGIERRYPGTMARGGDDEVVVLIDPTARVELDEDGTYPADDETRAQEGGADGGADGTGDPGEVA